MKIIYKYLFEINDKVDIELPYNSRVISIDAQDGLIFLWAIVDVAEQSKAKRTFYVFGTGHQISAPIHEMKHISTIQNKGFVWHIFE